MLAKTNEYQLQALDNFTYISLDSELDLFFKSFIRLEEQQQMMAKPKILFNIYEKQFVVALKTISSTQKTIYSFSCPHLNVSGTYHGLNF